MTLTKETLTLAAEALLFWIDNLDGEEDAGFADALAVAWMDIHEAVSTVAGYRVNLGAGDVYFRDRVEDMETEDNLVYVACGKGLTIYQISGCLRGEHDDVIADMRERWGDDVDIDGPWFPFDRRMEEVGTVTY